MERKMVYAPILITTLCRSQHFIREMESLKKNGWACYTEVYVALDYPKVENHRKGYEEILHYLETEDFSVFAALHVIKRPHNYGASANGISATNEISKRHDRWIRAEDDLEFSPNFIEYMDKCLMEYEHDERVFAINGYSYPVRWVADENSTVVEQNGTFSAWGCGLWRDKIFRAREELGDRFLRNSFKAALRDGRVKRMIPSRRYEYIIHALSGNGPDLFTRCSDMALGIYMGLKNMCVITPVVNKVKNWGFDGSGLYCGNIVKKTNRDSQTYDYENQPMDQDAQFAVVSGKSSWEANNQKLAEFLYVYPNLRRRARAMLCMYRLLGQERVERLYQKLKNRKDNS